MTLETFQSIMFAISPSYNFSKLKSGLIADKIDVFADQIEGFILAHARTLASPVYPGHDTAGFAVLTLLSSYFEMIASFIKGQSSVKQSAAFFSFGFLNVFSEFEGQAIAYGATDPAKQLDRLAREFYKEIRCALYHEALTSGGVIVDPTAQQTVQFTVEKATGDIRQLWVNPFKVVHRVETHFKEYLAKLRNPSETALRAAFEAEWDRRAAA